MTREERDRILQDCLTAADPLEAFDASALGQDSEAKRELKELVDIAREFERVGHEERRSLAENAGESPHGRPGMAEQRLREAMLTAGLTPRRAFPLRWVGLVAALLLATLFLVRPWERATDFDTPLGDGDLTLLAPLGTVEAYGRFSFEAGALAGERPTQEAFAVVRIYDAAAAGSSALVESPRLRATGWSPVMPAELPGKIRWRVTIYRGQTTPVVLASAEATAQRETP